MKKLIIAAAIAVVTIVGNAATVSWGLDAVYQAGTSDFGNGYIVYFINGNADGMSAATAMATLIAGDYASVIANAIGAPDTTYDEGYVDGTFGLGNYAVGESLTAYLVVFDSTSASAATYAFVSDEITKTVGSGGANIAFEFGELDSSMDASSWTKIGGSAVPEPTSALMLLVGLAGLALKRKVA